MFCASSPSGALRVSGPPILSALARMMVACEPTEGIRIHHTNFILNHAMFANASPPTAQGSQWLKVCQAQLF
jgi:hypothetical protein